MEHHVVDSETSAVVLRHTLIAAAAGLIPVPLIDLAAVTAIQIDMLKKLAELYGRDYNTMSGRAFVSALTTSTLATLGASVVKVIPGVGHLIGGVSMSVLAGASTYGVGQVATEIFASGKSLDQVDVETVKEAYKRAFNQGKGVVTEMQQKNKDTFAAIERLHDLKEKGAISEAEYEAQKNKLLERL